MKRNAILLLTALPLATLHAAGANPQREGAGDHPGQRTKQAKMKAVQRMVGYKNE